MKRMIFLATLFLVACSEETPLEAPKTSSEVTQTQIKNIGFKFEEFANNFNAKKSEYVISQNLDFKADSESPTATYDYEFNSTSVLRINIDKSDHNIQELTLIKAVYGSDNTERLESVLSAPVLASIITQSLNPTVEKEFVGKTILDLFAQASEHQNVLKTTVINNVNYSAKFDTEYKSYLFKVEP